MTTEHTPEHEERPKPGKKLRLLIMSKAATIRLAILAAIIAVLLLWSHAAMIGMPGKTHSSPLPPLKDQQIKLVPELERMVHTLAASIGERNIWQHAEYRLAADFIETELEKAGYSVTRQDFEVQQKTCYNLVAERKGSTSPDQIVVVGAHYDSLMGTVGANDNGSGVAANLALARLLAGHKTDRTIRFVFFANEEPPFFQTDDMGSLVYAAKCRADNDNIVAMLSLETIGYYSDQPKSQQYPFPFSLFYPDTGNFIAFVGNTSSRKLVKQAVKSFRANCQFPSQGGAIPGRIQGIGWSDHWAFWQHGYPALMVTDTAPFRYPYYHTTEDTADKIDYERLARVTTGLFTVVNELASSAD
jgi:hypothetical protein